MSNAEPGVQSSEIEHDRTSFLTARRRDFLIGAATSIVVQPAMAAAVRTPHFVLEYSDNNRRERISLREFFIAADTGAAKVFSDDKFAWDRREFGPSAYFSISRVSEAFPTPPAPGDDPKTKRRDTWWPTRLELVVHDASFPSWELKPFKATFVLEREDVDKPWKISATLGSGWHPNANALDAKPRSLDSFLGGEALAFEVPRRETSRLLRALFGNRIEAEAEIVLQLDKDLHWSIEAQSERKRGLYVLDIPLEFGRLALQRIRAEQLKPTDVAGAEAKRDPNSAGAFLFDGEARFGESPKRGGGKPPADGLYGVPDRIAGFTAFVPGQRRRAVLSRFALASDELSGEKVSAEIELDLAAFQFREGEDTDGRAQAAIRHWGDPQHTVAGCIFTGKEEDVSKSKEKDIFTGKQKGIGRVVVARRGRSAGGDFIEGPFSISGFEIVRQLRSGQSAGVPSVVVTRMSFTPITKEIRVASQVGGLIVAALPASSPKPGQAPRVVPLEIEAHDALDDSRRRILRRFEARFALYAAAIALPERIEADEEAGASGETRIVQGTHSWRLDFDDADALFYLPALGPPPDSSADAVIPVGPAPAAGASVTAGSPSWTAASPEGSSQLTKVQKKKKEPANTKASRDERKTTPLPPPRPPEPASVAPSATLTVAFDLRRARLTVLRPSDLLALKFRFRGLQLEIPWPPTTARPASLAAYGGRSAGRPDPAVRGVESGIRDERPILLVEFPPQHVAEMAYARRLPAPVELPNLTSKPDDASKEDFKAALFGLRQRKRWQGAAAPVLPVCPADDVGKLQELAAKLIKIFRERTKQPDGTLACDRVALRSALRAASTGRLGPSKGELDDTKTKTFYEEFAKRAKAASLPPEQQFYAGPEFLDPDARRIADALWRESTAQQPNPAGNGDADLPEVDLDPIELKAIIEGFRVREEFKNKELLDSKGEFKQPATDEEYLILKDVVEEIERAKERRDVDYAEFRRWYPSVSKTVPCWAQTYRGRKWFSALPGLNPPGGIDWSAFKSQVRAEAKKRAERDEPLQPVTPARLSGPSRIAFRIDSDDFEPDRVGGRIPFTLEGLTNWGGMDMVVVRRAERLIEPLAPGRIPKRWERRASNDEGAILRFQGFTPDRRWGRPAPRVGRAPIDEAPGPGQRLAEVYGSAKGAPDLFETALELPFRLFLSPAQDATWTTPSDRVRRDAFHDKGPCREDQVETFRELWTARLAGEKDQAGLRAIWSPDFRPEAFLSTHAPGAPPRSALAPWRLSRSSGVRAPGTLEGARFRTALDAYDRHELVALTSLHGLPVLGRRIAGGDLAPDASQIEPPDGFALSGLQKRSRPDDATIIEELSAIYRPKALSVSELALSALGGCLDLDSAFQPPASARDIASNNLFDALSVEKWRQRTVLGRDVLVEVVYKGFLFPIGCRASLVKLTERRFVASDDGAPVAALIQRLFLRVGRPEKRFPAEGQPNRSRRWPCDRVTILTRQTPDLVPVDQQMANNPVDVKPSGLITFKDVPTTGQCFWPRTARRDGAEVWFQVRIGDEAVPVRLPLIFVDNVAANDPKTMQALVAYYNDADALKAAPQKPTSPLLARARRIDRNGQPVVMAPEYKPGDTTFPTRSWVIAAEGREARLPSLGENGARTLNNTSFSRDEFMEGLDQPPFYPLVQFAECRLSPVERLTGKSPLWAKVAFEGDYVADGFASDDPNKTPKPEQERTQEIYLRVAPLENNGSDTVPLVFEERGDLGGGVARGEMNIVGLSRHLGPINKAPDQKPLLSPSNSLDTASPLPSISKDFKSADKFFPKNAKLLGVAPLKDLITVLGGLGEHPKLAETIGYGAASSIEQGVAEVRAILTDGLIKPALAIVKEVRSTWAKLAKDQLAPGEPDAKVPDLTEAYPQIGQELKLLEAALDNAQKAGGGDAEFFASLATIHEAARRLIRTIERIASDPLAAATGTQAAFLRSVLGEIDTLKQAIAKLRDIKDLAGQVRADLMAVVWGPVQARLVSWSPIAAAAATAADLRQINKITAKAVSDVANEPPKKVDAVLELPERLATALKNELDKEARSDEVEKAIGEITKRLRSLQSHILTEAEIRAYAKRQADEAISEAKRNVDKNIETIRQRLVAAVANTLFSPGIQPLLTRSIKVVDAFSPEPTTPQGIAEAFAKALPPVLDLLGGVGLAKSIADKAAALCDPIGRALREIALLVLPPDEDLSPPSGCADALAKGDLTPTCSGTGVIRRLSEAANVAITTLKKARVDTAALKPKLVAVLAESIAFVDDARLLKAALPASPPAACKFAGPDVVVALHDIALRQRKLLEAFASLLGDVETIGFQLINKRKEEVEAKAQTEAVEALLRLTQVVTDAIESLGIIAKADGASAAAFTAAADAVTALANVVGTDLPQVKAELVVLFGAIEDANSSLSKRRDELVKITKRSKDTVEALKKGFTADVASALSNLQKEGQQAADAVRVLTEHILDNMLQRLLDAAAGPVAQAVTAVQTLLTAGSVPLVALEKSYDAIIEARDKLRQTVNDQTNPIVAKLLDAAAGGIDPSLTRQTLFLIDPRDGADALERERDSLKKARTDIAGNPVAALRTLGDLAEVLRKPALIILFDRFARVGGSYLRTVVVRALDLRALRAELEKLVHDLVPTRATLSYDLSTPLNPFPPSIPIFEPLKGTKLTIAARTVVDLRDPKPPDVRIDGSVGPFTIRLLGSFDAVRLHFLGLTFQSGGGRSSSFDTRFGDVEIGEKAKFLKQLESYISPKGGRPPVRLLPDLPGIEAAYGINLGSFGVGTLSFSNVSLNAGARLPFKDAEAEFFVSIGRADAPFLISSTIFGGGGYLALFANPQGFIGLEASFDYGGVFAFGFGPLQGSGQITLGVFFRARRNQTNPELGVNFIARGSANIACFGFSTSLFVRLEQKPGGPMMGEAIYTFSFSFGIDDIEFKIRVSVNQGPSMGQGSPTAAHEHPFGVMPPTAYAALRGPGSGPKPAPRSKPPPACKGPHIRVEAPCQEQDWVRYRALFDPKLDAAYPMEEH